MFYVLTEKAPRRLHRMELCEEAAGDSSFFTVRLKKRHGEFLWRVLKKRLPSDRPVLPPQGVFLPPGVLPFDAHGYSCCLTLNAFIKITSRRRPRKLCFFDPQGQKPDFAARLLPLTALLIVMTDAAENFYAYFKNALSEYGTTPIITDLYSSAGIGSEAVFSIDTAPFPLFGQAPVFGRGGYTVTGRDIILPAETKRLMPDGADPLYFAGALLELCRIDSLSALIPSSLTLGTRQIPLQRIKICSG